MNSDITRTYEKNLYLDLLTKNSFQGIALTIKNWLLSNIRKFEIYMSADLLSIRKWFIWCFLQKFFKDSVFDKQSKADLS